jgi:tetratricopeptide (TPR) repeat protein
MELTKSHKIIISAVAVIILLGIYVTFDKKSRENMDNNADISGQVASSTLATTTGSSTTKNNQVTGDYKIEQVPVKVTSGVPKPIPDLTRKVVFGSDSVLTQDIKSMIEKKVSGLQSELIKKPDYLAGWIDLGIYQKMAGDYSGAVVSWKYASLLSPINFISPGNLGNLYAYFLKDNGQAELYYKEAISKGPTQVYLYMQLADVYREVFKDLDKARALVAEGLTKIPNDPNLLQIQTSLK